MCVGPESGGQVVSETCQALYEAGAASTVMGLPSRRLCIFAKISAARDVCFPSLHLRSFG